VKGFAAQLGFRVPNMVISPFTRRHYVSHIPMDHTAVIKFVENRFSGVPWATPPTPPAATTLNPCTPTNMGP
jgi:phospholipase C